MTRLFYLVLVLAGGCAPQFASAWSSDVQASGEFSATLVSEGENLYQVHMSPVSNLRWITTDKCDLELLFDDVTVEIYEKNGQRFGAVFRLISTSLPKADWVQCGVTGLFSEAPK